MSTLYMQLQVAEITRETADAVTIHLEHPEKTNIPYLPGQFLTLLLPLQGTQVRRSYSLSSIPAEGPRLSVTVKRVAGGVVSNYLCSELQVGDKVEAMQPVGNFHLKTSPANNRIIYLFGAGSGISPLMGMAKAVLHDEPSSRVVLLYGNRHEASIIFRQALDQLQTQYRGRFQVAHVLSQPSAAWAGYTGRLTRNLIREILSNLQLPPYSDTQYFLCGPEGMMHEVKEALTAMRVPPMRIHKENFLTTLQDPPKAAEAGQEADKIGGGGTQQVTVNFEGTSTQVMVLPDQSILEAALDQGLDLPFSCQAGLCTACMGKCLTGKVRMEEQDGLSEEEVAEGYVLVCVSHPESAGVVIEV